MPEWACHGFAVRISVRLMFSCQEQSYDSDYMACRSCSYPFPGGIWSALHALHKDTVSWPLLIFREDSGRVGLELYLHVTAELLLHPFRFPGNVLLQDHLTGRSCRGFAKVHHVGDLTASGPQCKNV